MPSPWNSQPRQSPHRTARSPLYLALTAMMAFNAEAQESTKDTQVTDLDKVQVTAQKRQQSEMEVPISMTVIGRQEIEAMRVANLQDFVLTVPNVTFTDYGSFSPVASIRGITSAIGGQFDPIGVTLDGISYGTTETDVINSAKFFDLEQIEVLRGPQGTLSGTNAMGGSINYISVAPDPTEFDLRGTADLSSYNTQSYKVSANLPMNDTMALRAVVYTEHSDGAVKNLGPGGGSSGYDNTAMRLAYRWQPTDKLTFDVSYATDNQNRGMDNFMYSNQVWGDPGAVEARAEAAAMGLMFDDPRITHIQDVGNNEGYVLEDIRDRHHIKNELGSFKLGYDTDNYTFEFLYGYFHHRNDSVNDSDYTEVARNYGHYIRWDTSNSAELRAISHYKGPVNWVGGVVWHTENNPYIYTNYEGDDEVGGSYHYNYRWGNNQELTSKAIYGSLFWDITPRTHFQVGARYNKSKSAYGDTGVVDDPDASMPGINMSSAELNVFSPKIALNYDLSKNVTTYVQWSTGFRDGYGNGLAAGHHQTSKGEFDVPSEVDAEYVDSYEIGVKGLFFDRILELTAAAFYMKYKDMQVYGGYVMDLDDEPSFDLNAGRARIMGGEVEATLRPFAGFELHAGYGRVDSKIGELTYGDTTYSNVKSPGIRPWNVSLNATYTHGLRDDLEAVYRLDWVHQPKNTDGISTADDPADPTDTYPSFSLLNASIGIRAEKWDVSLYATNLLDETWWLSNSTDTSNPWHGGFAYYTPRTVGIRLNYRFGAGPQ